MAHSPRGDVNGSPARDTDTARDKGRGTMAMENNSVSVYSVFRPCFISGIGSSVSPVFRFSAILLLSFKCPVSCPVSCVWHPQRSKLCPGHVKSLSRTCPGHVNFVALFRIFWTFETRTIAAKMKRNRSPRRKTIMYFGYFYYCLNVPLSYY